MRNKKGSLLIAITLLSVVLLIILMSIFNLNKKDTELITIKGDREKSFQASNVALKIAAKDIEKKVNDELANNHSMTWTDLYNLSDGTQTKMSLEDNNDYKYEYSYKKGTITAKGYFEHNFLSSNNPPTIMTANYLMDYVGISARKIKAEKKDGTFSSNMGFKAVYSYDTQYPMKPWINIYDEDATSSLDKSNAIDSAKDLISSGYITQIPDPLGLYCFTEAPDKSDGTSNNSAISATITIPDKSKKKKEKIEINSLDRMFNMCYALNLKDSSGKLFTDDCKRYSWMTFSIRREVKQRLKETGRTKITLSFLYGLVSDILDNLFKNIKSMLKNHDLRIFRRQLRAAVKVYDTLGGFLSDDDYREKISKKLGVKNDQIEYCLTTLPTLDSKDKDSLYKLNFDSAKISEDGSTKDVYRLVGRNIMLIPLNATVIIDGDLILEPEEEDYKKYFKTIYDLNKGEKIDPYTPQAVNSSIPENSYPVLLVTGNLVVNGSIKGIGTVMSMKNIIINSFPYDTKDYIFKSEFKDYRQYYDNPEKGAIIVNANGKLSVNSCDVNELLSQIDVSRLQMSKDKIGVRVRGSYRNFYTYNQEDVSNIQNVVDVDHNKSSTYANKGKGQDDYQIKSDAQLQAEEEATERKLEEQARAAAARRRASSSSSGGGESPTSSGTTGESQSTGSSTGPDTVTRIQISSEPKPPDPEPEYDVDDDNALNDYGGYYPEACFD